VYARAAASIYGLDRFKEIHWKRLEQALGVDARPVAEAEPVRPAVPPAAPVKALRPLPQRATVTADDPYL
jgi:phage terminase large subunit GpA-like protein